MPPVLVHIDDPIVPVAQASSENQSDNISSQQQAPYPPARPGAAAGPAPTSYVSAPQPQPQPSRTTTTTTTAQTDRYAPPPPQPGAVPIPPSQQNTQQAPAPTSLPPPPKAGEAPNPTPVTTMPPQMGIPPPQQNYTPTHSTSAQAPPTASYPQQQTTLNLGPLSSPPAGYHQNSYAQEISSAQRASLGQHEQREGYALGLGSGAGPSSAGSDAAGNVWNAVKGWANVAGTKLAETEEEVWKRINGKK